MRTCIPRRGGSRLDVLVVTVGLLALSALVFPACYWSRHGPQHGTQCRNNLKN